MARNSRPADRMARDDTLIGSYTHLKDYPRSKDALHTLKKIASMVKPIMRARGWHVKTLAEFWPSETNLLGMLNRSALVSYCR